MADLLGVSKKKIWQAVKDGTLPAERVQKGNAWRYFINTDGVEAYRAVMDSPAGWEPVSQCSGNVSEPAPSRREYGGNGNAIRETPSNATEMQAPPLSVYEMMLDRLQRAERRAVELELTLRQQQRLLAENAESITEREARARQAEAVATEHQQREEELAAEIARLQDALQSVRAPQKRSGLLGWFGFRKPSTAGTDSSTRSA